MAKQKVTKTATKTAKPAKSAKAEKPTAKSAKAAAPEKLSPSELFSLFTTFEPLLEQLIEAFSKKNPTTAAKAKKQWAKIKAAAPADEDEEESADADTEVSFPAPKVIAKMSAKELKATAATIDFDASSFKEPVLRALLAALATFIQELQAGTAPADTTSVSKEHAAKLAVALSVEPGKNHKETLKNIAAALAADEDEEESEDDEDEESEDEEEESEDESDEDEDEEDDEDEDEDEDSEEEDEDEESEDEESEDEDDEDEEDDDEDEEESEDLPDRDAVAKDFKDFPDPKDMKSQLAAYNKAADDDDEIEVEDGKLKVAYRKLVAKLVNSEGEIAEFGEPYNYGSEVMCCGLPLEEAEVKGVEQAGKCVVTGKLFSIDDDGEATEITKKKAKK